ncbi:MAG: hypothetical protein IK005_01665 [Paludibacteraceae bacterium]|nr:hypothetical protein [Paludibacteraceae bacterium]
MAKTRKKAGSLRILPVLGVASSHVVAYHAYRALRTRLLMGLAFSQGGADS